MNHYFKISNIYIKSSETWTCDHVSKTCSISDNTTCVSAHPPKKNIYVMLSRVITFNVWIKCVPGRGKRIKSVYRVAERAHILCTASWSQVAKCVPIHSLNITTQTESWKTCGNNIQPMRFGASQSSFERTNQRRPSLLSACVIKYFKYLELNLLIQC